MATGDNLTAAKAWAGAVCTALAPGAVWIAAQAQAGTVSGMDWLVAGALVVAGGAVGGGVVYSVENKPKPTPDVGLPGRGVDGLP